MAANDSMLALSKALFRSEAAAEAVSDLHQPLIVEVMAQSAPVDYDEWPVVEVEVCGHCKGFDSGLDMEDADESDVAAYLWPCPTARACGVTE